MNDSSGIAAETNSKGKPLIGHTFELSNFKTNTKKIIFGLILIGIIFSTYFVGFYFVILKDINNVKSFLNDMGLVCTRLNYLLVSAGFINFQIINGKVYNNIIPYLEAYLSKVHSTESSISAFINTPTSNLEIVAETLKELDSNKLCLLSNPYDNFCSHIRNNLLQKGMSNAILEMSNIFMKMKLDYMNLKNSNNLTDEYCSQLINSDEYLGSIIILTKYLYNSIIFLNKNFESTVQEFFAYVKKFEIIKFSIFCFIILMILFVFWRIFMNNLKNEVIKSRGILNLLPADFIASNNEVKERVLSIINF